MGQFRSILALVAMAASGCEFIPGTQSHLQRRAEQAAAQLLIDPSSALFRNVVTHDTDICGEINGKNRMGAYVGFVRFIVDTTTWNATLEPQPRDAGIAEQDLFDSLWRSRCGERSGGGPHYGFDGSGAANEADSINALNDGQLPEDLLSNLSGSDAGGAMDWETNDMADVDDAPVGSTAANAVGTSADEVTREWLDRALGRTAPRIGNGALGNAVED